MQALHINIKTESPVLQVLQNIFWQVSFPFSACFHRCKKALYYFYVGQLYDFIPNRNVSSQS